MLSPLAKYAGFYQQLLRGTANYEQLGSRLIQLGEKAHSLRQFDEVKEIGLVLFNIPIKRYQAIGCYFLAVAANSMGNGDQDEAKRLFEIAVDSAPDPFKVKAILSLGALAFHNRDFDSAFSFYREAIRTGGIGPATLQAVRGIATLKSIEGYHRSAIADVETILPLIRFAPSHVCFDCLNSYAVELSEVGRLQEAKEVSSLVISSPLIRYYPEWRETLSEIGSRRKQRSTVSISAPPEQECEPAALEQVSNVIQFPGEEAVPEPRVQIAIAFMSVNLHRRVSQTELAAVANLSKSRFIHLFKTETGLSPGKYSRRLRMEKASQLLATSLLRIKEVMAMVGYDNKSNFCRYFKKYFDLTPSAYRKRAFARHPPMKF